MPCSTPKDRSLNASRALAAGAARRIGNQPGDAIEALRCRRVVRVMSHTDKKRGGEEHAQLDAQTGRCCHRLTL